MKVFALLSLVLLHVAHAASLFKMDVKQRMSTDFLTGFESGLFLTNNTAQFDEYECPSQEIDSAQIAAFKKAIGPVKGLLTSVSGGKMSETAEEMLDTIELFASSMDKFIGVFDPAYTGGDFCAGLTFGMQGSKMLQRLAQVLYESHVKGKAMAARENEKKQGLA